MQTEIKMADGSKIQVDAEYDEARKQLVTDLRTFTEFKLAGTERRVSISTLHVTSFRAFGD